MVDEVEEESESVIDEVEEGRLKDSEVEIDGNESDSIEVDSPGAEGGNAIAEAASSAGVAVEADAALELEGHNERFLLEEGVDVDVMAEAIKGRTNAPL